ncbi:hypothetical protein [Enterococcus sp. HY326]|uniref:hypothetical protein n=1 Tax=Enterococcus sp. HY326 TaxID=2971265 RepID=UPI00223E976C|nr:hypothetical protein [Enterococcus sp. HY326]
MIFLHIVLGIIAFAASVSLVVGFRDVMDQLNGLQKFGIIGSFIGIIGSAVLGFMSAKVDISLIFLTLALLAVFTIVLFKKKAPKQD